MILEKSWWSFLVVVVAIAIVMVIALIIAVVIVKVWSSPKFPYLLLLCIFLCTKQGDWRRHILEFPLPFSGDLYSCRNNSMSMLTWVAAVPASQRRKGDGEGSSWCSGKLTWKSTEWCENGHGEAFYTQRVVAKPLKLFCWMIYTPCVSATFMSPVAKYEIHEI